MGQPGRTDIDPRSIGASDFKRLLAKVARRVNFMRHICKLEPALRVHLAFEMPSPAQTSEIHGNMGIQRSSKFGIKTQGKFHGLIDLKNFAYKSTQFNTLTMGL